MQAKNAPIREGESLLHHPLISKEPPENFWSRLCWVYWRVGTGGSRVGQRLLFIGSHAVHIRNQIDVRWGFGLGKVTAD